MKSPGLLTPFLILMYYPVCCVLPRWGFTLREKREREKRDDCDQAYLGCLNVLP